MHRVLVPVIRELMRARRNVRRAATRHADAVPESERAAMLMTETGEAAAESARSPGS